MATRQYIGARYVPKFYQNSVDGSARWESNVVYDPLTYVTLTNGHMYISKKQVPATVGTPASNADYWLDVGSYNGFIDELQSEIDTINNVTIPAVDDRIDEILEDKVICIGDSYAMDSTAGGTSWATYIGQRYGNRVTLLRQGGTGFASDYIPSTNVNWLSMLTEYANTLSNTQKNAVKQIVVVGGANDGNVLRDALATGSQIKARITQFITYCETTFPNAIVKIAFVGWHRQKLRYDSYRAVRDLYSSASSENANSAYYANGESIMHVSTFINDVDLVHPTLVASQYLAEFVDSVIQNGNYVFEYDVDCTFTKSNEVVSVSNLTGIHATYVDKMCQIDWIGSNTNNSFIQVALAQQDTVQLNTGDIIHIGTIEGAPMGAYGHLQFAPVHVSAGVYGGTSKWIDGIISIQDNVISYKHMSDSLALTLMLIPWGSLTLNLRNN